MWTRLRTLSNNHRGGGLVAADLLSSSVNGRSEVWVLWETLETIIKLSVQCLLAFVGVKMTRFASLYYMQLWLNADISRHVRSFMEHIKEEVTADRVISHLFSIKSLSNNKFTISLNCLNYYLLYCWTSTMWFLLFSCIVHVN